MWGYIMQVKTDYEKLEIYYNEYIEKIAKLIKDCNNLDMYQQVLFYDNLLHYGLLSFSSTFEYHDYVEDFDYNSILGARITNGNGVCRHMAANQRDVFKLLGYQTVDISCFTKYPRVFSNHPNLYLLAQRYLKKLILFDGHAISGIYSNKEHIITCPTSSFIGIPKSKNIIIMEQPEFPCEEANKYMVSSLENIIQHPDEHKKYMELLKLPSYFKSKSPEKLQQIFIDSEVYFSETYNQLKAWKSKNLDLIREIQIMDKKLSGYSDQPTRKLNR